MAGLYDFIKPDARPRTSTHGIDAALGQFALGLISSNQARDYLISQTNGQVTAEWGQDLIALKNQFDARTTSTGRLEYSENVRSACMMAETGGLTEVEWRNNLGI